MKNGLRKPEIIILAVGLAFVILGAILFVALRELVGKIFGIFFCGFGLAFFATGIASLRAAGDSESNKELIKTGIPTAANITGVELNEGLLVNGRCPYRVVCQFADEGQVFTCKSENLWYDPAPLLRGNTVTVYRDSNKPSRYYMDLSQVLPEVVEL